jgi:hypothetical protein
MHLEFQHRADPTLAQRICSKTIIPQRNNV